MVQLKPYPSYRDSGVPWLGAVPEHWEVKRNKLLLREIHDLSPDGTEELLTVSQYTGVTRRRDRLSKEGELLTNAASLAGYKRVMPGDLVINIMLAWNGSLGVSDVPGIVSPAYCVFRASLLTAEPRFLHYLFRTSIFTGVFKTVSTGVVDSRLRLYPDVFFRLPSLLPPLHEQRTIVGFLDQADRRIRRHIRAKQRLIVLLNEQKQAIIHQAVTRGLDPSVCLKPSGAEWLGAVPEHWGEVLLGRCLLRIDQGWSPVAAEGEVSADQWVVLTLSSVRRGMFQADAIKPVPVEARVPEGIEIVDGDLLLTRSNTRELVGDVCIVRGARPKTLISDLIYRLVLDPAVFEPGFLMYQLLSPIGRWQIERDARGSSGSMPKIAQRHIKSWRVVVPPIDEQRRIVTALDGALGNIRASVDRITTEINLLREYRTRLIADVVTGKLDVRAAAAQLPAEPDEPEDLLPEEDPTDPEEPDQVEAEVV